MHPSYHHALLSGRRTNEPLFNYSFTNDFSPEQPSSGLWRKVKAENRRINGRKQTHKAEIVAHLAKHNVHREVELHRVPMTLRPPSELVVNRMEQERRERHELVREQYATEKMKLYAALKMDSSTTLFQSPDVLITKKPTLLSQYQQQRERREKVAQVQDEAEAKALADGEIASEQNEQQKRRTEREKEEGDEKNVREKKKTEKRSVSSSFAARAEASIASATVDTQQFMERAIISTLYEPDWPSCEAKENRPPPIPPKRGPGFSVNTAPPPVPSRARKTAQAAGSPPPVPMRVEAKELCTSVQETIATAERSDKEQVSSVAMALSKLLSWSDTYVTSVLGSHSPPVDVDAARVAVANNARQLRAHEASEYHPVDLRAPLVPERKKKKSPPPVPIRRSMKKEAGVAPVVLERGKTHIPSVPKRPLGLNTLRRY
jgi:hypothetical protein